ncbi:MAG: hypothetical protein QME12_08605 [Nanoarchaeota archaeon]|nr:hypothetical protein [Nanoarchaeota archaeon]
MEKSAKEKLCEELGRIDMLLDIKYRDERYGSMMLEASEEYKTLSRMSINTYTQRLRSTKNGMGSD